jgi:hypothetical protein
MRLAPSAIPPFVSAVVRRARHKLTAVSKIPRYLIRSPVPQALFEDRSTPRAWASHARILRLSADALERLWQRDHARLTAGGTVSDCPYVHVLLPDEMLNGMALECLAKGIIASRTSPEEF